jgi:phosphate/sulfate permease
MYTLYMASVETDAPVSSFRSTTTVLIGVGAALAVGSVALLWWRFGESVYAQSIVSAILACF